MQIMLEQSSKIHLESQILTKKTKRIKKYTIWLFNIAMENHHAINIIGKPSINNQRVIIKHQKNKSITLW